MNNLNQYTQRTVPARVGVLGSATNTAIVTVNNQPTVRKIDYYAADVPVDNSTGPAGSETQPIAWRMPPISVGAGNSFLEFAALQTQWQVRLLMYSSERFNTRATHIVRQRS